MPIYFQYQYWSQVYSISANGWGITIISYHLGSQDENLSKTDFCPPNFLLSYFYNVRQNLHSQVKSFSIQYSTVLTTQQQKLEESIPLDISILLLGDRIFK